MGIRRLTVADHTEVLALFGKEANHYHFLLDDLSWNNYAGEQFLVFGEFESGRLVSLLLNNFNNLTYYSPDDRKPDAYRPILGQLSFAKVSGPDRLVQQFCRYLNPSSSTLSHMGMVKQAKPLSGSPDTVVCTIMDREELREQYRLLLSAEEYADLSGDEEGYISREWKRLASSSDRTVYLRAEGRMVAAASTFHERGRSALVTGVITHLDARNRGYASQVLTALFNQLLLEGRFPYLFYTNPAARSVYLRAGMEEICPWRVTMLEG